MDTFLPIPDYPSKEYLLSLHRHFNARLDQLRRLNMDDPKLEQMLRDFEAHTLRVTALVEEIAVRLALEQRQP